MSHPPPNAFSPGTPLVVGSHKISIQKYISEGGFAYVYSCTIDPPFNGNSTACLKRVVVPNKWQLTLLRQEVDAMKRLRGNAHIVSYIDSHASRLPVKSADAQQQYEVLLLMEFCSGKGLIDFMNTRLTNRLTEPEILSIMGQITTAVAMCHHLNPPLIHRDIKIENVLIDDKGTYKLCDFGSAVEYKKAPTTPDELTKLHNDIMQNTTPQYRAPEMIDLSHGFPIDDKSDIWALGVFLYKLCYYTTPFESPAQKTLQDLQSSILNCSNTLRFPGSPRFSARLQNVIHCCLRADPRRRPNALQLLQEICLMQNVHNIPDVVPYSVRVAKTGHTEHKPTKPELPRRDGEAAHKIPPKKTKTDTFATIDKSKILQMGKPRPKSEIFPSRSSASLHELVKIQVSESSTSVRKSEETESSTLDFLRSREESHSRQNTGGSFKASLKNGLRRISTGGSVSSQRSGSYRNGAEKSSSDESLKPIDKEQPKRTNSIQRRMQQLFQNKEKKAPKTASGYGKYTEQDDISAINFNNLSAYASTDNVASAESEVAEPESFEFNQKSGNKMEQPKIIRSASSKNVQEDKLTVPKTRPSSENSRGIAGPPLCPPSLSVRNSSSSIEMGKSGSKEILGSKQVSETKPALGTGQVSGTKKAPGPKSSKEKEPKKKAPPPKPAKPQFLKKSKDRRLSTSSEISLPDLDDLEKQFSRRFPSYV